MGLHKLKTKIPFSTLQNCLDFYEEVYHGMVYGPKTLSKNDVLWLNQTQVDAGTVSAVKLKSTDTEALCNLNAYPTYWDDVFFVDVRPLTYKPNIRPLHPTNVKMGHLTASVAQFNQVVFRSEDIDNFNEMANYTCANEEDIKKNTLAEVMADPSKAYLLFDRKGVLGSVRGEVLMVAVLRNVTGELTLRDTSKCWSDLPVWWNKKPYFRQSVTHILTTESVEVDCATDYSMFRIGEKFIAQKPHFEDVDQKMAIKTLTPAYYKKEKKLKTLLPYHLGTLYGPLANQVVSHLMSPIMRRLYEIQEDHSTNPYYFGGTEAGDAQGDDYMGWSSWNNWKNILQDRFNEWKSEIAIFASLLFFVGVMIFASCTGCFCCLGTCADVARSGGCTCKTFQIACGIFTLFYKFMRYLMVHFRLIKPEHKFTKEDVESAMKVMNGFPSRLRRRGQDFGHDNDIKYKYQQNENGGYVIPIS